MTAAETTSITLRRLGTDEGALLDDLVAALSPRSRYLRFHSPIPELTARMRRALLAVDERDHIALVAQVDGTAIGIARMIRDASAPDEAEITIAVVDAWQRRGVGRRLAEAIAEQAAAAGVTRLNASVLAENEAALGLFRATFPVCLAQRDGDVVNLVGMLGAERGFEITMDDILADLLS